MHKYLVISIVIAIIISTCLSQTIKKCSCPKDEAKSKSGCVKKSPLFVQIWNSTISKEEVVDISKYEPVVVEPLKCPDNLLKEKVIEWAFISEEGKLMKYPHPETDQYCIENLIDESDKVSQSIEYCIPKVPIRLCCKTDEYMDSSGRCTKFPTKRVNKIAMKFLRNFDYSVDPILCEAGNTARNLLNPLDPISEFNYLFMLYKEQTSDNFCIGMYGDENEIYPGVTYCESMLNNQSQTMTPNIPHCCPDFQAFALQTFECLNHTKTFKFPKNIKWPSDGALRTNSAMNCSNFSVIDFDENNGYFFSANGSLHSELGTFIQFEEYCLGAVLDGDQTLHSGLICSANTMEIPCSWRWMIYRVCLIISTLFVIATLIVYIGVPELRRRIGGLCLISELIALLVSQITLIILQTNIKLAIDECLALGVIEIIFVLGSFFWLNIMCFDVWSTFRVFRPYSEKSYNVKLFVKYSLYGWGVPLIVGIVAVALEKTDSFLKPGFTPRRRCFFDDESLGLHWFYMYGIILILILVNLGFFIHLSKTLWANIRERKKHFKGEGGTTSANDQNQDMENVKICGKLFIIMGLPWLLEVFTSFATKETLCYIWFLDVLNLLRGVLIFVIFVMKKTTRDMILKSWFPSSYKPSQVSSSSSQPSRKTSTISLTNWLPSFHGRKISKVSMNSGHVNLEAVKEESPTIKEEDETL